MILDLLTYENWETYKHVIFDILYANMNELLPTGNSKEQDFLIWSQYCCQALEKDTQILLCHEEDDLIGYCQFRVDGDTFCLDEIELKKEFQQKGILKILLRHLINCVLPQDLQWIEAHVNHKNQRSIAILTHWGMQPVSSNKAGTRWCYRGEYSYLRNLYQDNHL